MTFQVHMDGLEGRILSCPHPPLSQELPALRLSGDSLRISENPIRLLSSPTPPLQMCGDSAGFPCIAVVSEFSFTSTTFSFWVHQRRWQNQSHTRQVMEHLFCLRLIINWKKSTPFPSKQVVFLAILLDSASMTARLSEPRQETILSHYTASTLFEWSLWC